jgi:hypothetical protein
MRTPIIHTATAIAIRMAYHTDVSRTTLRIHAPHHPQHRLPHQYPLHPHPSRLHYLYLTTSISLPLSHYLYLTTYHRTHQKRTLVPQPEPSPHIYVGLHNKTQANASTSQTPKRAPKWPQKQKAKAPSTPASKASRSPARSEPTSSSTSPSPTPGENDSKPYRPAAYTLFLEAALRSGVPGG